MEQTRDYSTQQTQETQTAELLEDMDDENVPESQIMNQFNVLQRQGNQKKQNEARYQDLDRFKSSPNNPLNQKNQGLSEIMNDSIQNMEQELKGKSKKSIPESKYIMKQGGENQDEIKQALHKNADKPSGANKKKNSDEIEEESSEQMSQDSNDDSKKGITEELFKYISDMTVKAVAVKDDDINYEQQQQNIRLKNRGDDYQKNSKDLNADALTK